MPSFNAGTAVEALDYTLEPYVKKSGTIPEPSSKDIEKFLDGIQAAVKELIGDTETKVESAEDLFDKLEAIQGAKVIGIVSAQAVLVADMCKGEISAADLDQLPHRVKLGFLRWFTEQVMRPELAAPAGPKGPTLVRRTA